MVEDHGQTLLMAFVPRQDIKRLWGQFNPATYLPKVGR